MVSDNAREVLEQWAVDHGLSIERDRSGYYRDEDTQMAWSAVDTYASTLRQQACPQFANPEALADWLDTLHECHADGSVGNRKWEAAQVAARAIRSLNEPSGNSGQLRQQAGRVDEPRAHQWDRDGERCVVCGDKDWMGGPCNGPRTAAPSQRAEVDHG